MPYCCKAPVDADDDTMAKRLQALQLDQTDEEGMDVDGDEVTFTMRGQHTRKRQVNTQNSPNKTQKTDLGSCIL